MAGRPRKVPKKEPAFGWDDVWGGGIDPETNLPKLPEGAVWDISINTDVQAVILLRDTDGTAMLVSTTAPSRVAILESACMLADHVSSIRRLEDKFGGKYPGRKLAGK